MSQKRYRPEGITLPGSATRQTLVSGTVEPNAILTPPTAVITSRIWQVLPTRAFPRPV